MTTSYVGQAKDLLQCPEAIYDLPQLPVLGEDEAVSLETANNYRPELYAILAIVTANVVDTFLESREAEFPYGLVKTDNTPITSMSNFAEFEDSIVVNFKAVTRDVLSGYESAHAPMYERLSDLCEVFYHAQKTKHYSSPQHLMRDGVGTSVNEGTAALAAITRVVTAQQPNTSQENVATIARNSAVSLIGKVAAVNINHLAPISSIVHRSYRQQHGHRSLQNEMLWLKTKADGSQYVGFVGPVLQLANLLSAEHGAIGDVPIYLDTLGCPSAARLDDESALHKLWDWMITIAEKQGLLGQQAGYVHKDYML